MFVKLQKEMNMVMSDLDFDLDVTRGTGSLQAFGLAAPVNDKNKRQAEKNNLFTNYSCI